MANVSYNTKATNTTINSTETSTPLSSSSIEYLVWISNERQYEINRPTLIIYIISIILGLLGNSLVIYVFGIRLKKSAVDVFVLCLAVSDTFTCVLLIFETLDLRFPFYSGNYPILCKVVRFLEVFANSCSSILLVCIAFDRFYKICKPSKYIPIKKARKIVTVIVVATLFLSWPIALFHGPETIETIYPGLSGKDCADDDEFKGSIYSGMYFFLLLIVTLCCIGAVIVLYLAIFCAILKWKFTVVGEKTNSEIWSSNTSLSLPGDFKHPVDTESKQNTSTQQRKFVVLGEKYESAKKQEIPLKTPNQNKTNAQFSSILKRSYSTNDSSSFQASSRTLKKRVSFDLSNLEPNNQSICRSSKPADSIDVVSKTVVLTAEEEELVDKVLRRQRNTGTRNPRNSVQNSKTNVRMTSTTIMFALIAVLYVLSYIPTLTIESINAVQPLNTKAMSVTTQQLIVIANSAYFMNPAFNPILYGVFNKRFRDEIVSILKGKS